MNWSEQELIVQIGDLSAPRLHRWIRLGWVRPERREGTAVFDEVDLARVRLLRDLEQAFDADEDTVPMVLSLLDQIHGLRFELRSLALAIEEQPEDVRDRIKTAFRRIAAS